MAAMTPRDRLWLLALIATLALCIYVMYAGMSYVSQHAEHAASMTEFNQPVSDKTEISNVRVYIDEE